MDIKENIKLAPYTTFYIGGPAKFLAFVQNQGELEEALEFARSQKALIQIMGGGSNVLVSDNGFDGLVIRIENVGMDIANETEEYIFLQVASGEVWDDVVRFACEQNWFGIENLSHIPGFAGGFAIQNVGAYGQEASQVVFEVEAYDQLENKVVTLNNEQCQFGYRKSIFNSARKNRYIILTTTLRLQKDGTPNFSYGDLKKKFSNSMPSLMEIRQFIIDTRNKKFPFPDKPTSGNSGSFFRGPLLSDAEFNSLAEKIISQFGPKAKERLVEMEDRLKVSQGYKTPTAFLLELCQLTEQSVDGASINRTQPAIIVNSSGSASSEDVISLYKTVAGKVYLNTGVKLEIEPELVGFSDREKSEITNFT